MLTLHCALLAMQSAKLTPAPTGEAYKLWQKYWRTITVELDNMHAHNEAFMVPMLVDSVKEQRGLSQPESA